MKMVYRKERPKCRKALLKLCKEFDCDLTELLKMPQVFLSPGLKVQAHKMLDEGGFYSAKEISDLEKRIVFNRAAGLIK